MFLRDHGLLAAGIVFFGLLLSACGAPSAIPAAPEALPTPAPRVTEAQQPAAPAPTEAPQAQPTASALPTEAPPAPAAPAPTEAPQAQAAAAAPSGDAAAGKAVWAAESCRYCHGDTGQGVGTDGPALAGTALTWDEILATVRNGRPGTKMQAFKASIITEQELADIYAWLKTQ